MKSYSIICVLIVNFCLIDARPSLAENQRVHHMHPKHDRVRRAINSQNLEQSSNYWRENAQETMKSKLARKENTNIAKNVILFIGDGMSIPTLAAARTYMGQKQGLAGEEYSLSFEKFPYTGLSKTYCVDHQVADSACSSTAYMCGVKANSATLGVNANVPRGDCDAMRNASHHVDSIMDWAQQVGKATGIVTTTRITHASPSGAYAHTAERDWESDKDVLLEERDPNLCRDIAWQLINQSPGNNFKVILGGGRKKFLPESFIDEEGTNGERADGANLISKWLQDKEQRGVPAKYIWDKEGLINLDTEKTDYVLGLFEDDHLQYNLDRDTEKEPSLADLTSAAIKMLSKEEKGFVLFIEGGRIDHAHHDTIAKKALDETEQLSEAVALAAEMLGDDTLIVVTSDHAHTMSLAGYAARGSDVLGIAMESDVDNLPYSILSYANGPGYKTPLNNSRYNIINDPMNDKNYKYPSTIPALQETHGGDDVGVFCTGPWSHLCTGSFEQNVIPHIMAYASCIGNGLTACNS